MLALSGGWWIGSILFFVIWLAIAFWPARVAVRKGHSFLLYFLFSLVFFPAALLVAYMVGDRTPDGLTMASTKPAFAGFLVACVLSFALVAAGCGGDDDSSSQSAPEEWADSFCSALSTWTDDLEAAAEPLTELSSLSEDSIQQAAEDANTATQALVESMRSLGSPDTSSGDQVETAVQGLTTDLESDVQEIERAVEDVSSIADIPGALGTITTTLSELGTDIGTALQTIGDADASGELETAFEDADSCAELTDSSG